MYVANINTTWSKSWIGVCANINTTWFKSWVNVCGLPISYMWQTQIQPDSNHGSMYVANTNTFWSKSWVGVSSQHKYNLFEIIGRCMCQYKYHLIQIMDRCMWQTQIHPDPNHGSVYVVYNLVICGKHKYILIQIMGSCMWQTVSNKLLQELLKTIITWEYIY